PTERLEQHRLALHHGQRCARTDVSQTQHRGAVADHDHQAMCPRVPRGQPGVLGDRRGNLGHAGRVGDGKLAGIGDRPGRRYAQLAPEVTREDLLVGYRRRGARGSLVGGNGRASSLPAGLHDEFLSISTTTPEHSGAGKGQLCLTNARGPVRWHRRPYGAKSVRGCISGPSQRHRTRWMQTIVTGVSGCGNAGTRTCRPRSVRVHPAELPRPAREVRRAVSAEGVRRGRRVPAAGGPDQPQRVEARRHSRRAFRRHSSRPGQIRLLRTRRGVGRGRRPTGGVATVKLSSENISAVYIPEGLGHAFVALTDHTVINYYCSAEYNPSAEHGVSPLDEDLNLPWPADIEPILSDKDRSAPTVAQAREQGLLPSYQACTEWYEHLRANASSA